MPRRLILPALVVLAVLAGVTPAAAAGLHHRHSHSGDRVTRFVRFLNRHEAIERFALRDVDNDGDLDVLAAPRDGKVVLWRNGGHGRFRLATMPRGFHLPARRNPRFARVKRADDGWQWGDDRYEAAMPRAPAAATVVPLAVVRAASFVPVSPVSVRRSSGRAPPLV